MQSAITSKLSLYDIISMVVPGGVMVGVVCLSPSEFVLNNDIKEIPSWGQIFIFLVASYLIGLINNFVTELIWINFRNNTAAIAKASHFSKGSISIYIWKTLFVIFLVYVGIELAITIWLMLSKLLSVVLFAIIILLFFKYYSCTRHNRSYNKTLVRYYIAYYYVERTRPSNAAKIIEAQVAFLKTMCLPLCMVFAYIFNSADNPSDLWGTTMVTTLFLMMIIAIAGHRQNTIYRIVVEDYKYLSKQNQK